MNGAWHEFTVSVDASPSRPLVADDLARMQALGDAASKHLSDLVLVYDPAVGCLTLVFQVDSTSPWLASAKGAEAVFMLFQEVGVGYVTTSLSIDEVRDYQEIMSREALSVN